MQQQCYASGPSLSWQRMALSLQISLSPDLYNADEASGLLKTLSMWLNKTGQVNVFCICMSIPLPSRASSTGWL